MLSLSTLGRIDLRRDDGTEVRALLAQPKRLALFVYLARQPEGHFCRRDTLLGMFWPELSQERGRAALRKALHFIRQAAGGEVLATRGADEVALAPGTVDSDAAGLLRAAEEGRFAQAVGVYGGDFLPGFYLSGETGFERWLDGERERLRTLAADCVGAAVAGELAAGRAAAARALAERGMAIAPDDEGALRLFMATAARAGDRGAALAAFHQFAERLAAEYELEPAAETRALAGALPPPDPGPQLPAPPPPRAPVPDDQARAAVPPAEAAPPARRRWARPAAVVAAISAAAVVFLARGGWTGEPRAAPGRLAVLPFQVSGPAEVAYLGNGLPVLLATRLDGAGPLRGVDAGVLHASAPAGPVVSTERSGATAAERLRARFYVVGSVRAAPSERLHVTASLHDRVRGGRAVAVAAVEGAEAQLQRVADEVATRLLAELLQDAGGGMAATAARTTRSPAALKSWLRGEDAFRRGRYEPAIAFFRAATREDSLFALAQYRLSVAASWAGDVPLQVAAARRASALGGELSPHSRTLLQAMSAFARGRYHAAEPLYLAAARARPDDPEAWFGLAESIFHGRPPGGGSPADSRVAFEEVLRLDPGNFAATAHLARLAALRRDTAELDRLTAAALAGEPDGPHRAELLLLRALGLGDAAARHAATALAADEAGLDALWRAAGYTGALGETAAVARTILRSTPAPERRASLHLLIAHLEAGRGCAPGAARHLDALAHHSPATAELSRALFAAPPLGHRATPGLRQALARPDGGAGSARVYMGRWTVPALHPTADALGVALHLGAGDTAAAVRAAATLRGSRDLPADAYARALTAGDPAAREMALRAAFAADTLTGAPRPYFPRALLHLAAADLLAAEGRPDAALARLQGVPQDLGFDVALLAAVHHRRAELLERLGRRGEAARERARGAAIQTGCR